MIFPESLLTKHLCSSELKQFCSTLLNNYRSCKLILKEMIYTPFKAAILTGITSLESPGETWLSVNIRLSK